MTSFADWYPSDDARAFDRLMADRRRPLWSILIPTLASRQGKFLDLTADLADQAAEWDRQCHVHGQPASGSAIEIVALHNNGEHGIGVYRQRLLDSARGRWVSFVDDDDRIAATFVTSLATALVVHGPQVVGFPMWIDYPTGGRIEADLSLRYDGWERYADGRITCDLTIIQPIRADLARLGRFDTGAFPEDRAWRAQVRPHLDPAGEHYLPGDHLYWYQPNPADSVQSGVIRLLGHPPRPDLGAARHYVRWAEL